jgi:hypothetical protein
MNVRHPENSSKRHTAALSHGQHRQHFQKELAMPYKTDETGAIIIPSGLMVSDIVAVFFFSFGVAWLWPNTLHSALLIIFTISVVTATWILLNRNRLLHGKPFLKLTEQGLNYSALGEDVVFAWTRMREAKLEWHRVDVGEGYESQAFFAFVLDKPQTYEPVTVFAELRAFMEKTRKSFRKREPVANAYPIKMLIPLKGLTMFPSRIGRMLMAYVAADRRA